MDGAQRDSFLLSRDRYPQKEAVSFTENQICPPGQPLPVYSEQTGSFISADEAWKLKDASTAMWEQADGEKERLFALMTPVEQKLAKKKSAAHIPLDTVMELRRCSWSQVLTEVERTADHWKSSPNLESKRMVFIDRIGRHSESLEAWLNLLPMGDYGASICGAASTYSNTPEIIFEFLAQIPDMMESSRQYMAMYRNMGGHRLDKRSFELFRAVLEALTHVMQFFLNSRLKNLTHAWLKQGAYQEGLQRSIENVRTKVRAFRDEAQQCHAQETHESIRLLSDMNQQSKTLAPFFQRFFKLLETNLGLEQSDQQSSSPQPRISAYDMVNATHILPGTSISMNTRANADERRAEAKKAQNQSSHPNTTRKFQVIHDEYNVIKLSSRQWRRRHRCR
ncbi:uncharacterized protein BDZ83DRAFT_226336 [Colletotrichum acutatum]|uniref:Uncharacterized protein n=1 Tax=Glomerella acutata TaxID=27357 RepID=A0AAD8XJN5_GLOAC|nr:uncharacterized protein BDZ83DRAFT_226336 [Colletotrichum acutatum]KAK1727020.1 hypothetical protein BDZ83DRAFT_226336 [Colletotrichum acutatum]